MFSDYPTIADSIRGPGVLDMLGGAMPRPPDLSLGNRPESYNQHTIEGILGTRGREALSLERINKGMAISPRIIKSHVTVLISHNLPLCMYMLF
jgi:hypothetical protein